jgi:hypothetical protein
MRKKGKERREHEVTKKSALLEETEEEDEEETEEKKEKEEEEKEGEGPSRQSWHLPNIQARRIAHAAPQPSQDHPEPMRGRSG